MTTESRQQESPTIIINAPIDYERTHSLTECPLPSCRTPDPHLDMHMQVREFGYFDLNLYTCNNLCNCGCNKVHKFSVKHDLFSYAEHLKIYDRTHIKDVW